MKLIQLGKEQLEKLNTRERYYVLGGSVIILLLLFYYLILSPFFSLKNSLRQQVQDNHALARWMQMAQKNLQQLQTQQPLPTKIVTHESLAVTINNTLNQQLNSYPHQIEAPNLNQVNIVFNNVPFDDALDWIILLWQKYGIRVSSLTATPQSVPGTVQLNLTVEK